MEIYEDKLGQSGDRILSSHMTMIVIVCILTFGLRSVDTQWTVIYIACASTKSLGDPHSLAIEH